MFDKTEQNNVKQLVTVQVLGEMELFLLTQLPIVVYSVSGECSKNETINSFICKLLPVLGYMRKIPGGLLTARFISPNVKCPFTVF